MLSFVIISRIMVSRIEIKPEGCDWIFDRGIMAGESCGISNPLMDGGVELIVVRCDENDLTTTVTRLFEEEYFEDRETGEICFTKDPIAVLKLGDPHYVTSVQSQLNSDNIDLRISHQKVF